MNHKLQKLTAERRRIALRLETLQSRHAELDKAILELENLELHSLLHGANMTFQDLTAYIRAQTSQPIEQEQPVEQDQYSKWEPRTDTEEQEDEDDDETY